MTSADDPSLAGFSYEERNILANVDRCLAEGVAIKDWWRRADATGSITESFELTQVPNRPDKGYSFFATASLPSGPLPVMGDVPNVFYDQPKGRWDLRRWTGNVREFALRYFTRISSFELPQEVVPEGTPTPPPPFNLLSWCPQAFVTKEGFGYQQLYYKLRATGEIGRFPAAESFTIVDQRELATKYEWVVAIVDIFNFVLSFPPNPELPRFGFPMKQSQYIIFSDAFLVDETDPAPGLRGRYQFGYAMLKPRHDDSILVYGPGQFDAGFQLFTFTVQDDGTVRVNMPFVVNRPSSGKVVDPPPNYAAMVDCARRLARGWPFVRVDLYGIAGRTVFGEMTLSPGAGSNRFIPESYEYYWGRELPLPRRPRRRDVTVVMGGA